MRASTARSDRLETPNSAFRSPSCRSQRTTGSPRLYSPRPVPPTPRFSGRPGRRAALQSSTPVSSPVLVLTHPLFLQHHPGRGHPESPQRLSRTLEFLEQHRLPTLEFQAPRLARPEELARVHDSELLEEFGGL